MTRYGGWDDPRWEERERTAGERWRSERGSDRWREPAEEREWGRERRDWPPEAGGRYGTQSSVGWGRGEREELDPPWVERGPAARRAGRDPRGLVEWEDRGPLQWMGDKIREAKRSRGPKGYRRSDDRLQDAVCERIARSDVDASEVEVKVEKGEVTLTGNVRSRREKWWLEDIVDNVFGVEEVHNQLRVAPAGTGGRAGEVGPSDLHH
jgi:hypothetical protein